MKKLKLLCLPYAGGSATYFYMWKKELGQEIDLIPLELAGRGKRMREELMCNFDAMLEDVFRNSIQYLDKGEYAIFGHSMGAILGFELIRKIAREGKALPSHIFLSAANAPSIKRESDNYSKLNDEQFIKRISALGGMSEEVLQNKELMSLFLPIMRADFKVLESYKYHNLDRKLPCKASILYGSKDSRTSDGTIFQWLNLFDENIDFYKFEGNHFFINPKKSEVISIIKTVSKGINLT